MLILGILQNFYSGCPMRIKDIYRLEARTCNLSNATYSRIKKIWYRNRKHDCWLTECSRSSAKNHQEKLKTDHQHIKRVLELKDWDLIICFGKQAEEAVKQHQTRSLVVYLPHPASWKWRKTTLDCIDQIYRQYCTREK